MPENHPTKRRFELVPEMLAAHGESDECLVWPFNRHGQGYGQTRIPRIGSCVKIHRYAFFLTYGHWPTPQGRHTCDNPPCFNPRHIVEGTMLDNMHDRDSRGRANPRIGILNGESKLSDEIVKEMRRLHASGIANRALARRFGVTPLTAKRAILGVTWKHVP